MWQKMMRVWLVGTAVTMVTLDGAPPAPPRMSDQTVEQSGDAAKDIARTERYQGTST